MSVRSFASRAAALTVICSSLFVSSTQQAAAEFTVETLAATCKSRDVQDHQMCEVYFLGAMNAFEAAVTQYGAKFPFCYPKGGLSADDMSLVFRLWASTNPNAKSKAAIAGIIMSMTERFPCHT